MMGGGTEEPVHEVVLSPYFMMSMEVTQELWNAVMPDVDIYALRVREVDISKAHGEPDDYALHVHKVGTLKPNSLGIYDMSGNVLEWCQDRYLPYEEGSQADPLTASSVPGSDIVCRGGGWKSRPSECAVHCRYEGHINFGDDAMGFRVVCAAE